MDRFVCIKDFNKPINLRNILPGITNKWQCCVHSYLIGARENQIYSLHCNVINSDRNLKVPILLTIYPRTDYINYVEHLRWKNIIVSDVINFELSIVNSLENKINPADSSFVLLIFRKNEI